MGLVDLRATQVYARVSIESLSTTNPDRLLAIDRAAWQHAKYCQGYSISNITLLGFHDG